MDANKPINADGRTYHLQTREGDLARLCLLPGSPERAEMIAKNFFKDAELVGDHRGSKSYTGTVNGVPMSVVNTCMGPSQTAIIVPEVHASGGRILIRVGSCSTLWPEPRLGESAICDRALRFDGASDNWVPDENYQAVANFQVTDALVRAAEELKLPHYVGTEATTSCFVAGQGRLDINGYIPPHMKKRHESLIERKVLCYSMEAATLFAWGDLIGKCPVGAINAIYGNRITNEFEAKGDEEATRIAIQALLYLDNTIAKSTYL